MKKNILLLIIFVLFVQPYVWQYEDINVIKPFDYVDEILGVIAILYILRNFNLLFSYEKKIIKLIVLLLIVGFISTINAKIQTQIFPVCLDAFQCIKCFVVFIYANHIIYEMNDEDKINIIKKVNHFLLPLIAVAFVFSIVNIVSDIGMHDVFRHGMRGFRFICRKSGTFSDQYFYYLIFITIGYSISMHKKTYTVISVMAMITWMLTLRTRSIVYAPLFLIMYYWIVVKGKTLKIKVSSIALIAIIILLFGADKIESTYGEDSTGPRNILLFYGIKLMQEYMPLGAGFGSYGTDVAAKFYSSLYYDFGFHNLWGMGPDDNLFLHDNYWPAIMGQFGLCGVLIVVCIIFFMGVGYYRRYSNNNVGVTISIFTYIALVLNSSATPTFFTSSTIFLFILIPLANLKKYNHE